MPLPAPEPASPALVTVTLTVNGDRVTVAVPAERTLLALLRDDLRLTGSKQGCDGGECGACTVLVDDEPMLACLVLAAASDGRRVDTVESLSRGGTMSRLQRAFVRHGATQCGFCTPGMLMSASALLAREPHPDRAQVRAALSGNLCRCTGYTKIIDAVVAAGGSDDGDDEAVP